MGLHSYIVAGGGESELEAAKRLTAWGPHGKVWALWIDRQGIII
jgi:hypothetical protein